MSFITDVQRLNNSSVVTTFNGIYTVDSFSSGNIVFNGTNDSQIVQLPNALTHNLGYSLTFVSNNTEVISVVDGTSVEVARLEPFCKEEFILQDNTTSAGIWIVKVTYPNSDKFSTWFDDFASAGIAGQTSWRSGLSGTGASITLSQSMNGRRGVVFFNTGSTATGTATLIKNDNTGLGNAVFGNSIVFVLEFSIRVQNLATALEDYIAQAGYLDTTTTAVQDGAFFEYNRAIGGDFWKLVTSTASVRTEVVTTVPMVQNTWNRFRIESNRLGNKIKFFINGAIAGESTTNIPTGIRNFDVGFRLQKTVGTGIRPIFVDYATERLYLNR